MVATFAVGVAGGVAPVQIYTSYDVAVAAAVHDSEAVFAVPSTALLAGNRLLVHTGGGAPVVKLVLLPEQPLALPTAFLGITYQLYNVFAVRPLAL